MRRSALLVFFFVFLPLLAGCGENHIAVERCSEVEGIVRAACGGMPSRDHAYFFLNCPFVSDNQMCGAQVQDFIACSLTDNSGVCGHSVPCASQWSALYDDGPCIHALFEADLVAGVLPVHCSIVEGIVFEACGGIPSRSQVEFFRNCAAAIDNATCGDRVKEFLACILWTVPLECDDTCAAQWAAMFDGGPCEAMLFTGAQDGDGEIR